MNELLESREEVKRAYLEIQKLQGEREFSKEEAEGRVSTGNEGEKQDNMSDSDRFGSSENMQISDRPVDVNLPEPQKIDNT